MGVATEICAGRAQMRAFFQLERRIYGQAPRRFVKAQDAFVRVIRAGGACLLTLRDGEPAARAAVLALGDTAFFSLFESIPDEEAARSLLDALCAWAAEKGCERLTGPVSADGSGFSVGVRLEGGEEGGDHTPWFPQNPPYYAGLLRRCGLREASRLLALRRPLGENPFPCAARWAQERGIHVEILPLARRATLEEAWTVCEDAHAAGKEAFERVYGRVCELAPRAIAVLARAQSGQAAGWALCEPEGEVFRVLQLQALPRWRRTPCAAAILDAAWQEAARLGARAIAVGTIDESNSHSLPMARHAGFQSDAAWAVFARELR